MQGCCHIGKKTELQLNKCFPVLRGRTHCVHGRLGGNGRRPVCNGAPGTAVRRRYMVVQGTLGEGVRHPPCRMCVPPALCKHRLVPRHPIRRSACVSHLLPVNSNQPSVLNPLEWCDRQGMLQSFDYSPRRPQCALSDMLVGVVRAMLKHMEEVVTLTHSRLICG